MRTIRVVAIVAFAGCLLFAAVGCAAPKYVHAVFFTYKPDVSQSDVDVFVNDAYERLAKRTPSTNNTLTNTKRNSPA